MISVCMTTYKGEKYREVQITSILENISENDELIISEDGQGEEAEAFLEDLNKRGAPIVPIKGPGKGVVANFEYALRYAKGDIIFLADQDDIWTTDKVEKVMKAFQNPECMLVIHDADIINEKDEQIAESFFAFRNSRPGLLKNIWKNSYIGCCMAFRRELLDEALPFPQKGTLHDQWLGLMAEKKGKVIFLSDKLVHYRRHSENVSGMQHLPVGQMLSNRLHLVISLTKRKCSK